MPAKRPRLTFMPSDPAYAAISRIAAATRQPMSSIVAESMDLLVEHLVNMAEVLEHASALSTEAKAVMIKAADSAADELRPVYLEARRVIGDLARKIEDVTSEAGPPPSNTGVTFADEPLLPLQSSAA